MTTLPEQKILTRAVETAEDDTRSWIDHELDELVHDAASSIASNVNNGGTREQMRFLLEQGILTEALIMTWENRSKL